MSVYVKIKKSFGNFVLDTEFEAENEILALLGASGSGKSMTLKCIAGIVKPDMGRIVVDGVTLFDSEKDQPEPSGKARRAAFPELRPFPQYDGRAESIAVIKSCAEGRTRKKNWTPCLKAFI